MKTEYEKKLAIIEDRFTSGFHGTGPYSSELQALWKEFPEEAKKGLTQVTLSNMRTKN